jgi:hypothetical protein
MNPGDGRRAGVCRAEARPPALKIGVILGYRRFARKSEPGNRVDCSHPNTSSLTNAKRLEEQDYGAVSAGAKRVTDVVVTQR